MKEGLNKVVVFFGGKSVEREVSIITGVQVINKINPIRNEVFPIYINESGQWLYSPEFKQIESFKNVDKIKVKRVCFVPNCNKLFWNKNGKLKEIAKIDIVINCCHGAGGENGELAGVLESYQIPSISPGVLAGAISMDKMASKIFFKGLGLNQVESVCYSKTVFDLNNEKVFSEIEKFGMPVVVKPCSLGSSVGVRFCKNLDEVKSAVSVAFAFDNSIIVERGLEGFDEFFCSAFSFQKNTIVSEIEKNSSSLLLDFDEKYLTNHKRNFPAKIKKDLKEKIQQATKLIYESLKCKGIIRVDFLYDKKSETLFVNEANVIPGSLAMGFWSEKFDMTDIFDFLMLDAKNDFVEKQKLQFCFPSNILENFTAGSRNKLK